MNLTDPILELLGYLGAYLSVGAVGLRYGVLAPALGSKHADSARSGLLLSIGRRASAVGLGGAILALVLFMANLITTAGERHLAYTALLMRGRAQSGVELGLLVVAIVGFGLVLAGQHRGWLLAAVGAVGAQLSALVRLQWTALVNPVHIVAGAVWLGTLFAMMVIAVPAVLRSSQTSDDKALTVADLVYAFSPLALIAGGFLVASGIITAWRHLKFVAALWTTSYGIALLIKLAVVAVVFALGAWNWKRVKPTLGTPAASDRLKRSARLELLFAGIVLVLASVLVSLPSPKLPK